MIKEAHKQNKTISNTLEENKKLKRELRDFKQKIEDMDLKNQVR